MKKIIITGANGIIGTVLQKGLKGYKITSIDLPLDVRNYQTLLETFPSHDVIIHLAWETQTENYRSGKINPDNTLMVYNVYEAAIEVKVPRVIMASSVHADNYSYWKGPGLLSPERVSTPDSPYGASKVFMEALGRYYATKGLEVVCLRFGGINPENIAPLDYNERIVWLSHHDCVNLVKRCIEAKIIPNNFSVVYAISDNKGRIHDYLNPLGWIPKDGA